MHIHKVSISIRKENPQVVKLPKGFKILSCDFQGDDLVAWFTTPDFKMIDYHIYTIRTGEEFPDIVLDICEFAGTAYNRDNNFPFVIHLFYTIAQP